MKKTVVPSEHAEAVGRLPCSQYAISRSLSLGNIRTETEKLTSRLAAFWDDGNIDDEEECKLGHIHGRREAGRRTRRRAPWHIAQRCGKMQIPTLCSTPSGWPSDALSADLNIFPRLYLPSSEQ